MLLDPGEYVTFKQAQEDKCKNQKRGKIRNRSFLEVD